MAMDLPGQAERCFWCGGTLPAHAYAHYAERLDQWFHFGCYATYRIAAGPLKTGKAGTRPEAGE